MALIKGVPGKGMILKEYGQNIQKIVDWILTIEDKEQRTKYAYACIDLMRQLNPNMKDGEDYSEKLWDHLYIMSGFALDVDSPFPKPDESILTKKPNKVDYNQNRLRYKYYGKNIELLVKEALAKDDPLEKEDIIIYLGRLMKKSYTIWNKENVDDDVIIEHLSDLSKGALTIESTRVKEEKLFDTIMVPETRNNGTYGNSMRQTYSNHNNSNRRSSNNNNRFANKNRRKN
ncbi:MAG: DUF4290 domain-containing protein [Cytophagaceae bacterium]|jgi:hypothetical protein|nr:DUF4290 domain-containing protein [Cytophagaceae bacterium]